MDNLPKQKIHAKTVIRALFVKEFGHEERIKKARLMEWLDGLDVGTKEFRGRGFQCLIDSGYIIENHKGVFYNALGPTEISADSYYIKSTDGVVPASVECQSMGNFHASNGRVL